jgi:pimeloyl-ACP methyl ester carboxylesterase
MCRRLLSRRGDHREAVVLLHGWPGDRTDYREVVPLLPAADVVVPDLRGFGGSDKHPADPAAQYSANAQARSVVGLLDELGLDRPVLGGYDIGSRIAQTVARQRPDLVRALVVSPPLPGIGDRILTARAQQEFWYQPFHQLPLAVDLLDGRPDAVRRYLRHFWSHWSGPGFALTDGDLDHLVSVYAGPGAFTASIGWYRAGAGAVARSAAERAPQPADRIAVPHDRAVARTRPAVPARVVRPARRVLRRREACPGADDPAGNWRLARAPWPASARSPGEHGSRVADRDGDRDPVSRSTGYGSGSCGQLPAWSDPRGRATRDRLIAARRWHADWRDPVLLVTGPVGVGKTAVLLEAHHLLAKAEIPHAAVVLEEIARSWPPPADDEWSERIAYRNLASLWSNFATGGAERLLLERVLEQRSQLRHLQEAIPDAQVTVVRLRAPLSLIEERVRTRQPHAASEWHLGAARWLAPRMDRWSAEDHLVENGDRPLGEVAREVLRLAGWLL